MKKIILLCAIFVFANRAIAQQVPNSALKKYQQVKVVPIHLSRDEKLKLITSPAFKTSKSLKITPKITMGNTDVTMNTQNMESSAWVMFLENLNETGPYSATFVPMAPPNTPGVVFVARTGGLFLFEVSISTGNGCPTNFNASTLYYVQPQDTQVCNYIPGTNGMGTLYFTAYVKNGDGIELTCQNMVNGSTQYWNLYSCNITEIHQ